MNQTLNSIRRQNKGSGNTGQIVDDIYKMKFPELLEMSKKEIARALPNHIDPNRIVRIALTAFRKNPELAKCQPMSVLAAVFQASQLGLEISMNGEAFLVPFKDHQSVECQLIPGYQGLMKLARNTGVVRDIYAHEVYENDHFELDLGLDRKLVHKPMLGKGGFPAPIHMRGEAVGFYAVAILDDGIRSFVPMSLEDVMGVRDDSKGYQAARRYNRRSPWDTHFIEMAKKTVIRALCKMLPKSSELNAALNLDRAAEMGLRQQIDLQQVADGIYEVPKHEDADANADSGRETQSTSSHQQRYQQQRQSPQPSSTARAAPRQQPAPQQPRNVQRQGPVDVAEQVRNAPPPPQPQQPKQQPQQAAQQAQQQAGVSPSSTQSRSSAGPASAVNDVIGQMKAAKSMHHLDELSIRAESVYDGADLVAINRAFDEARDRICGNAPAFPM